MRSLVQLVEHPALFYDVLLICPCMILYSSSKGKVMGSNSITSHLDSNSSYKIGMVELLNLDSNYMNF